MKLFARYIWHVILKRPIVCTSYTHGSEKYVQMDSLKFRGKPYETYMPNSRKGLCLPIAAKRSLGYYFDDWDSYFTIFGKRYTYKNIWYFLGYTTSKAITSCSYAEFKLIYGPLFYPCYANHQELVNQQLNDDADIKIPELFLIAHMGRFNF